jgi:hypothetical protein
MAPDIIPIVVPRIDWTTFLKTAQDALGYSPVKAVDHCSRPLSDYGKFLVVAASFQDRNLVDALGALRDANDLLNHLAFVFNVYADAETILLIMERTRLRVTMTPTVDGERIAIVSGNLQDWHQATIICCADRQPFNLRLLFDKVVLFFESLGLGELWHATRKKSLPDRTFLLEPK